MTNILPPRPDAVALRHGSEGPYLIINNVIVPLDAARELRRQYLAVAAAIEAALGEGGAVVEPLPKITIWLTDDRI